jgi:hypothetical protein
MVGAGSVGQSALDGELGSLLRDIAGHSERIRKIVHKRWQAPWKHTTIGWIVDRQDDFVMLMTSEGYRAQVPLGWALRIHRAEAGQALVLIMESFDNVVIHNVCPGLWVTNAALDGKPEKKAQRPAALGGGFGGPRGVRLSISNEDADRLEGSEPPRVLVPVTVTD